MWNHDLFAQLSSRFEIVRSHSMDRTTFLNALRNQAFGDFVAIYRPFWSTGGEMGRWDAELISLLPPSCKIYTSAGAGFDWVDTKLLAERGIIYCNSASACTESVADCAIWHILSTFRLLGWSSRAARSCDPAQFTDAHNNISVSTHNPNGHTLGIIGLGKIGYRIAQKAYQAFGMHVIYQDVVRMDASIEHSISATYFQSLDDMLTRSDCVVLATPFAGDLLMTASKFKMFKRGARFVNIARGKLVDEEALVAALESGQIGAAGLDVHFDEPHVNPRLAAMRNVEVTSHTAGGSLETHMGFEKLGMENILSYFDTGAALTPVNRQWLKT